MRGTHPKAQAGSDIDLLLLAMAEVLSRQESVRQSQIQIENELRHLQADIARLR